MQHVERTPWNKVPPGANIVRSHVVYKLKVEVEGANRASRK